MNLTKRKINGIPGKSDIIRIKLAGKHMARGASILVLHHSRVLHDGTYVTTKDILRLLKGAGVVYKELELK